MEINTNTKMSDNNYMDDFIDEEMYNTHEDEEHLSCYEEPKPGFADEGEKGLLLQFSVNGRNISDFILERSDILFMHEEMSKWLTQHPVDSDELTDDEIKKHIETTLKGLHFGIGSSRVAKILRELANKWDD